jgi:putative membrane-bound dehydrogenase-like protein
MKLEVRRGAGGQVGLIWLMLTGLALAEFPPLYNSEKDLSVPLMAPKAATASWKLPPGFSATLFAAEPEVQNPIAMAWDTRGRLWVAENYTYAERTQRFDLSLRDRILILEDTNGDGRCDRRTVFADDLQMLTGLVVGHGGVWVMCPPYVLFIPDRDQDDRPDGPVQVILDGFTVAQENYHNFANGLKWGPDGWLYGRCGASCPGRIGLPGTPDEQRVPLVGTLWRYHPVTRQIDVLSAGTTNPWGHDWNELGDCFFINTVNGHLWHGIPGAHFVRPHTLDPNRRVYELIDFHADHWHFDTGKSWTDSRAGAANEYGGGHAHIGAMIYLGDNWPAEYRGRLFTVNMHGLRVNQERLERVGSGYLARHEPDFAISGDPWFRGMELSYGPDGAVYVIDWSDTGECHENTGVHRESGRIFRIGYGEVPRDEFRLPLSGHAGQPLVLARGTDLRSLSNHQLVQLQLVENEWFARTARLVLHERKLARQPLQDAVAELKEEFRRWQGPQIGIRLLLTLHAVAGTDREFLWALLNHHHEALRSWGVRLLSEDWPLDDPASRVRVAFDQPSRRAELLSKRLVAKARHDAAPAVRLTIASTLQRLPVELRTEIAAGLASHVEDAEDHNLPLMVWYGLIPVSHQQPEELLSVLRECQWPRLTRLIARSLAEEGERHPAALAGLMQLALQRDDVRFRGAVIEGLALAYKGWRKAPRPAGFEAFATAAIAIEDPAVQGQLRELRIVFGDGRAISEVRQLALDAAADVTARQAALQAYIESRADDVPAVCEKLLGDHRFNVIAARGLALQDDPQMARLLVENYRRFRSPDRPQVISLLVSRASFAEVLLQAMADNKISREDLSAYQVRQIHSLGVEKLSQQVSAVWGELRDSPAEKLRQMEQLKRLMTATAALDNADLSRGRQLFEKSCAACHLLYGQGGKVGPDLTGSNRGNLDYLLENIVDPSATVNKDFRMTILQLADGRILNGLVTEESERSLTLRTATESVTLDQREIEVRKLTNLSPMPEGLLSSLAEDQVRDLLAYLRHPVQVPLPADGGAEPAANP